MGTQEAYNRAIEGELEATRTRIEVNSSEVVYMRMRVVPEPFIKLKISV